MHALSLLVGYHLRSADEGIIHQEILQNCWLGCKWERVRHKRQEEVSRQSASQTLQEEQAVQKLHKEDGTMGKLFLLASQYSL